MGRLVLNRGKHNIKGSVDSVMSNPESVLSDSLQRLALYSRDDHSNVYRYDNPLFAMPEAIVERKQAEEESGSANSMRLKDFLASISSFSNFSDHQLVTLERRQ